MLLSFFSWDDGDDDDETSEMEETVVEFICVFGI